MSYHYPLSSRVDYVVWCCSSIDLVFSYCLFLLGGSCMCVVRMFVSSDVLFYGLDGCLSFGSMFFARGICSLVLICGSLAYVLDFALHTLFGLVLLCSLGLFLSGVLGGVPAILQSICIWCICRAVAVRRPSLPE